MSASSAPLLLRPRLSQLIKLFFFSLIMMALGVFSILDNDPTIVIKFFALIAIIFGGLGLVLSLSKIIWRSPTLIISPDGLYPNFLAKSVRQIIPWGEIDKINKAEQSIRMYGKFGPRSRKIYHLAIYLKDPKKFSFDTFFTKEMVEEMTASLGSSVIGGITADLYVPENLLPQSVDATIDLLRKQYHI